MISILFRLSQSLLLSHLVAASSYVPLSIGPDFQAGFGEDAISSGLKLNINDGESLLRGKIFEGTVDVLSFKTSNQKTVLIEDLKSLEEYMDIGGGLGISYGPMCCGEASNYLKNKASPYEATVAYRYQRVAYAKKFNQLDLVEELRYSDLDADTIAEEYGTKFIDQMNYGAQLDVEITFKSRNKKSIDKIKSELKDNTNLKVIQAKFESNFGLNEKVGIAIKTKVSGLNFLLPLNPNIEQITVAKDRLDNHFNSEVEQQNLLAFSPIEFSVASISDHIESLPRNENSRLESNMNDVRKVLYSALFFKQTLIEIRKEQESIYSDPRDKAILFNRYSQEVEKVVQLLGKKIEECLRYRRHTLKELMGREGTGIPKMPEDYVKDEIAEGLIGDSLLRSPVTIGTTEFMKMYYSGYSIETDGIMQPWLSGSLRIDDSDSKIIANAKRPNDLETLGREHINFDARKVVIRTKQQNEENEFHLHQWTGERKADGPNLESLEITNSGSISLEYMVQVQDIGTQEWVSSGFVGGIHSKYITGFAIRIVGDHRQHTVSYKAYKVDPAGGASYTQKVSEGNLCGDGNGAIKAIYVDINPIERAVPCEKLSKCQCGISMCHDPEKTFSPTLSPSSIPSLSPSSIPSMLPTSPPTSIPSFSPSSVPSLFPTSLTPAPTSSLTPAPTSSLITSPTLHPTSLPKQTPFPNPTLTFTNAPASILTDDDPTTSKVCVEESTALNTCQAKNSGKCGNCVQKLSKIKLARRSSTKYCEDIKELFLYCGCDVCAVEKDASSNCHCDEISPSSNPLSPSLSSISDGTSGSQGIVSIWFLLTIISYTATSLMI